MSMFVRNSTHKQALNKIEHLEKSLAEAQNLKFVFEALVDKAVTMDDSLSICMGSFSAGELILPDDVPRYVDDYYGGRVIKQEATPVTILDEKGKATYGMTAKRPDKNKKYILHD